MSLRTRKLKFSNVVTAKTAKAKIPTVHIDGAKIRAMALTDLALKRAAAAATAAAAEVKDALMRAYWEKLEADKTHSPSVLVTDATGASVRVTSQCRYSAVDADAANALFDALDVDGNDYLIETVAASFDNNKFIDANGNFNVKCYKDMHAAIAAVAIKYGIENPLKSTIKITPKPEFHEARAATFTAAENLKIYEVMKNTIALTVTDVGVEPKPALEAGSKDEES